MVNINGKEWTLLEASDIQSLLSESDLGESFYFEFKEDDVSNAKVIEEVSAFANTFGGFIFLGVSDSNGILGFTTWDEQRIHNVIHNCITPTPAFDVKQFTINNKAIYVIKIDEGAEPPYITNRGKIYERLSSGSFAVTNSAKLSQIYTKKEQLLDKMERKISIPPITEKSSNIYGYIDLGFSITASDPQVPVNLFNSANIKDIAAKMLDRMGKFSLTYVGNSIIFVPAGVSSRAGVMPAHINNFLEVMADGSARMRILLINNDPADSSVNMIHSTSTLRFYQDVYSLIMGDLFPYKMAYAKKYEALTVQRQFNPIHFYEDEVLKLYPDWQEENEKMLAKLQKQREVLGVDTIVTNDRIPKTGLYTIDRRHLELWGLEYNAESILSELFLSRFVMIGAIPNQDEE